MPKCRCPNCKTNFIASSSVFGTQYHCKTCGNDFKLDIEHLARYKLPNLIDIQLQNKDGTPFTDFPVPVIIHYGYDFPPVCSDVSGHLLITRKLFQKIQNGLASTGVMDQKGDYSLIRYIDIKIPSQTEAAILSYQRANSGWPILDFEREIYGNISSLLSAYIPKGRIDPASINIDLSEEKDLVKLDIVITQSSAESP